MARVLAIEQIRLDTPQPVYNFTVKGPHTYFVLDAGVLVHNAACPLTPEYDEFRFHELPEDFQDATREAIAIQISLPRPSSSEKSVAGVWLNNQLIPTQSGWTDWSEHLPFAQHTDDVLQLAEERGIRLTPDWRDPPNQPGKFYTSHAERQAERAAALQSAVWRVIERNNKIAHPIGVSFGMCSDCQSYSMDVARITARMQVVADPKSVRVFLPNGRAILIHR